MEPATKRARISDGRALPAASTSSAVAASAAAAAVAPSQLLSAEMMAVNELIRQHPQDAISMFVAARTLAANGPWIQPSSALKEVRERRDEERERESIQRVVCG
jgi:hypothetical protein